MSDCEFVYECGALGGQRCQILLVLEFQVAVSSRTGELGTKLRSSSRASLNVRTISFISFKRNPYKENSRVKGCANGSEVRNEDGEPNLSRKELPGRTQLFSLTPPGQNYIMYIIESRMWLK